MDRYAYWQVNMEYYFSIFSGNDITFHVRYIDKVDELSSLNLSFHELWKIVP